MSIGSLLYVARDSLLTNQLAIDITGANIANANTPGYTRQRPIIQSIGGTVENGSIQTAVNISKVERQYNQYLESQLINQKQNTGYSSTLNDRLTTIEGIFDETIDNGVTDQLNEFWASWETLSANPAGEVERNAVVANAQTLSSMLASVANDLAALKSDVKTTIRDTAMEINSKISELRDVNAKIAATVSDNGDTNILQDKIVSLVGDIGEKININWFLNQDGTCNVFLADGTPIVQRIFSQGLRIVDSAGSIKIYPQNETRDESLNGTITKGSLGALLNIQDTVIPDYLGRINTFAQALAEGVNEQHHSGFDRYGNAGRDFFTYTSTGPATSLGVNSAIIADLKKIAAGETVASGDGANATKMAGLQNVLLLDGNTMTLNNYYASIVGDVGRAVSDSQAELDHQMAIMDNVTTRRESVSGVSIDEEMINLMKYQMGYSAAGRLAKTVSEMLDTLMALGE